MTEPTSVSEAPNSQASAYTPKNLTLEHKAGNSDVAPASGALSTITPNTIALSVSHWCSGHGANPRNSDVKSANPQE